MKVVATEQIEAELNWEKRKLHLPQWDSEDYLNLYIQSATLQWLVTNSLFVPADLACPSLAGVGHKEVSDSLYPSPCIRTGNYARSTAANSLQCQLPSCNSHDVCPSFTSWYQQSSPGSPLALCTLWLHPCSHCCKANTLQNNIRNLQSLRTVTGGTALQGKTNWKTQFRRL